MAVGDSWHGPFTVLGNPHPSDTANTSFHSQISSVFKVPGKKDLYIACADRWLPEHMDQKYEEYARMFEAMFDPEKRESLKELAKDHPKDVEDNTSIADYVWLPLRFEEPSKEHPLGMVYIDWLDEWRIEDYE